MPKQTPAPTTQTSTRTAAPKRPEPVRVNQAGPDALVQRALADPASLTAQDVVQLQRQLGNHAVQGLLSRPAGSPASAVQRAPAPSAGAVAEAEMETELPEVAAVESAGGGSPDSARPAAPPDDDPLQRKSAFGGPAGLAGGAVDEHLESRVQRARGGGQALPAAVRARMEGAFRTDFSAVKIHTDTEAHTLNRSLGARAFTTGPDIFFKSGEFEPAASDGEELLAHELTHVVQQGGALRRKPNLGGAGLTKRGAAIQREGDDDPDRPQPLGSVTPPPTTESNVTPPTEEQGAPPTPSESLTQPESESESETTGTTSEENAPELDSSLEVEDETETEDETDTEDESETETDTDTESEDEAEDEAETTSPPVPVTVDIPVYPPILTERDWAKHKSWAAKLGRDNIGIQLGLVSAAHRGIVWNRFDIRKLPPDDTPIARNSDTTIVTARNKQTVAQAAKAAAKTGGPRAVRAASRAIDAARDAFSQAAEAAKAAVEEAETGLGHARAEYSRNVMILLAQLHALNSLLVAKQGKSASVHTGEMITALKAYTVQVADVKNAFQAYETALEHAHALEAEAKQSWEALGEEDDEDEVAVEDLLTPPVTDEVEGLEVDEDETETVAVEESESEEVEGGENAPVTAPTESVVTPPEGEETESEETTTDTDVEDEVTSTITPPTVKRPTMPTMGPVATRTANPTITIPALPALFSEREWSRNKGLAAKLGRDTIGIQLGMITSAHRGVVWDRFNLAKFPPGETTTARDSVSAAAEARAALARGNKPRDVNNAKTALVRAQETAKAAAEEAEGALGLARAEFQRNVILLLAQTQMLHTALQAQAAKSSSDYLTRMAAAATLYTGQIDTVRAAFGAFEQARDYARALEDEAKQAIEALQDAEDDVEDSFGSSITAPELELGNENAPEAKPVNELVGGKLFAELDRVLFHKEIDVEKWTMNPDLAISARDFRPTDDLRNLLFKAKTSRLAFNRTAADFGRLRNQSLSPSTAKKNIDALWKSALNSFSGPGGVKTMHFDWTRKQDNFVGGDNSKYRVWADKYPLASDLHNTVKDVLLTDQTPMNNAGVEVTRFLRR